MVVHQRHHPMNGVVALPVKFEASTSPQDGRDREPLSRKGYRVEQAWRFDRREVDIVEPWERPCGERGVFVLRKGLGKITSACAQCRDQMLPGRIVFCKVLEQY